MSYEKNKILGLLYRIFQAEEYTWGVTKISPSFSEIEKTVNDLEQSAFEVKGFAETGRIKVLYDKDCKSYTYYLNLGESYE